MLISFSSSEIVGVGTQFVPKPKRGKLIGLKSLIQ